MILAIVGLSALLLAGLWLGTALPRKVRLAAALIVTAATVAGVWSQRTGSHPTPMAASQPQPGSARSDERVTTVENSLRALEDAEHTAPRDRWDPAFVAGRLGRDPRVLSRWVRDNTAWIPYRGILRGATGVLMDRQGNSLDRAILLATLLELAGHTVRLAHGELSAAEALRRVVAHADVPARGAGAAEARRGTVDQVRAEATRYGLDANAVARTVSAHDAAMSRIVSEFDVRIADQTSRLLRAVPRPDGNVEWWTRFHDTVKARRDHWWVQVQDAGTWSDLDVDDERDGVVQGTGTQTLLLKGLGRAGLHHQITVRVIAERWSRGTLTERVEMAHLLRPADLIGQSIVLQFVPESSVQESGPLSVESMMDKATHEQRAWTASLTVGSEVVASGILENAPMRAGALGGLGGAIGAMARTDDRTLSAVWLEYEFVVPGEAARVTRRAVFDLVGPAARASNARTFTLDATRRRHRAMALTTRTELLPLVSRFSRPYIAHLVAENLLQNRDLLRAAAQNFGQPPSTTLSTLVDTSSPLVTPLYSLALARLAWADTAQVFINRPGLLARHTSFAQEGSQTHVQDATDIVANHLEVSLAVPDAFPLRVAQGVIDTNAEALLRADPERVDNAAIAFASDHPWVVLAPASRAAVDQLLLDPDVRQRIRDDLAAGFTVVAPRSPVPGGLQSQPFSGWWRIDPLTGQTLGMGANGWGRAAGGPMAENTAITHRNALAAKALREAGYRALAGFSTGFGFCVIPEVVTQVEAKGFRAGLRAAVVEKPGECIAQGVFFGALAAVPMVVLSVNLRLGLLAASEAGIGLAAGEATAGTGGAAGEAAEGAAAAAEGAAVESGSAEAAVGEGGGVSPRGNSVPPPAPAPRNQAPPPPPRPPTPRSLPEIEGDIATANRRLTEAKEKFEPLQKDFENQVADAQKRGVDEPRYSNDYANALKDKIDAAGRLERLTNEYLNNGGQLGGGREPAGPMPKGTGWVEAGPHAGELLSPGPSGSPVNPLANTVPVGGPQYAPVRGGPPNLATDQTQVAGLGGLIGIK